MAMAAQVGADDHVIEIGPGLGILTGVLVRRGCQLTTLELDDELFAFISGRYPSAEHLHTDAAKVNWVALCADRPHKVVANLPYNVGTKLVMDLLRSDASITSITVMLQAEVVARMLAGPGSRTYGALSVQLQVRAEARYVVPVPAEAFVPPPKVASAVIHLRPREVPQVGEVSAKFFDKVVRAAFSQRRKMIRNALSPVFGRDLAAKALGEAGVDGSVRAEVLDAGGFRRLAAALQEAMHKQIPSKG